MRIPALCGAAILIAAALPAQIVVPFGTATTEGNTSTAYPWGRGTSQIRVQYIYDSTNFTNQGVVAPQLINELRWRANTLGVGVGGTYNNVTIQLSTCPVDQALASTTFASNHGVDVTTVYSGPVTVLQGAGTTPNNWYVDVVLTTPFIYDPSLGDLTVDIATDATGWVGGTGSAVDAQSTGALTSRIYNLTSFSATTGSVQQNVGIVMDIVVPGYAQKAKYGAGCPNLKTSVYENFPASTIDLGTTTGTNSLLFTPNGIGGYIVGQGSNTFYTPTSPDLLLGDDTLSVAQTLPFTFNYPGGSTTSIKLCSNGYVWLDAAQTVADLSATPAELLAQAPRMALIWNDLNPAALDPVTSLRWGTITYEVDPVSGDAVCTWLNVPQYGTGSATTPLRANTFQVALRANGSFEYRFQECATTNIVVTGFSEGLGANDPGSINLSDTWTTPVNTGLRAGPLGLDLSGRPIIGGSPVSLDVTGMPPSTTFGAIFLSFTKILPGIDLTPIGATGCSQFAGPDVPNFFVPSGASYSMALGIPNSPSLSGLPFVSQAIALAAGFNPIGIITSNGVDMKLGIQ